jgi:sorbitol/mannitol transport system permease protein
MSTTTHPEAPGSSATPGDRLAGRNSLTAAVLSTTLVLVLAFPAAHALSIRPVNAWTDVLFFLSTKMLSVVAGILPLYLFAQKAHLLDNIWWFIVLCTSMNLPIAIWMLRSLLADVPVEMLEAAQVDGAGLARAFAAQDKLVQGLSMGAVK